MGAMVRYREIRRAQGALLRGVVGAQSEPACDVPQKGGGGNPCGRRRQAIIQIAASGVVCVVSVCQRPSRPIQTSV